METLRNYFKVLVDDGLLQAGSVQEHDIKYLYDKICDEQYEDYIKQQESYNELNVIEQYQR